MDLEVVGRHALLFDDDSMAAFVNSGEALVDWHSLNIDRYDVRHLLSAPPPPRGRSRKSGPLRVDDLRLEAQLDHERYLDLLAIPDQPDAEEEEKKFNTDYRAVTFSYGNVDDSADQKNADVGMESTGFRPSFTVPEDLHCLPHSEKEHQIISRTALFVSKHGGQSEIILRVKQGDNPTFGFLMPGHHLHAYFRYLVEHPDLLHSESHGNLHEERSGSEQNTHGVVGALSLLGSVYGSGEDEEADNPEQKEQFLSLESIHPANHSSLQSEKIQENAEKCESDSKTPVVSNKEKVRTVTKNSSIAVPRSGCARGLEDKPPSGSTAADKSANSEIDPVVLEPPPDLKILIGKLVEYIMRNGKQFEANLIEQDRDHGRFPFLLRSNKYYPYYIKVLQGAQVLKVRGGRKDDYIEREKNKNGSSLKDSSSLASAVCDIPWESDRKEKFKMVMNKSRKEAQETESGGTQQESGFIVDAAAAAAILQAATRGINSNWQHGLDKISPSQTDKPFEKSGQAEHGNVPEVADNADSSGLHLTKEQMLKAERLKRAKMFVAMLRGGDVPSKTGHSCRSPVEPLAPGVSRSVREADICGQEREGSLVPGDVDDTDNVQKPSKNYFGEERTGRDSKRRYRPRYEGGQDDGDGDVEEDNEGIITTNRRSKSRRHDRDYECDDVVKSTEKKRQKRRHRNHSSENSERETSEENRHHQRYESEELKQEDRHGRGGSIKRNHSHDSSREHSRKRHSSKRRHVRDENETDDERREQTKSRKKQRSHHSRDRHRHRHRHEKSRHGSKQGDTYSVDEHQPRGKHEKELQYNAGALEEGEVSSKVLEETRGTASNNASKGTPVCIATLHQRAPSEPSDTSAEVPDDLRAKVRAMLIATRL